MEQLASPDMQRTLWVYQISESQWVCNSPGSLLRRCNKQRQSLRLLLIVLLLHCYQSTWSESRLFASDAATASQTSHYWSITTITKTLSCSTFYWDSVFRTSYCSSCGKNINRAFPKRSWRMFPFSFKLLACSIFQIILITFQKNKQTQWMLGPSVSCFQPFVINTSVSMGWIGMGYFGVASICQRFVFLNSGSNTDVISLETASSGH